MKELVAVATVKRSVELLASVAFNEGLNALAHGIYAILRDPNRVAFTGIKNELIVEVQQLVCRLEKHRED